MHQTETYMYFDQTRTESEPNQNQTRTVSRTAMVKSTECYSQYMYGKQSLESKNKPNSHKIKLLAVNPTSVVFCLLEPLQQGLLLINWESNIREENYVIYQLIYLAVVK